LRALIELLKSHPVVNATEGTRAVAGASLGIFVTGVLAAAFSEQNPSNPGLIAPMGAAAVLLFATPSSPLARPWPVLGGSLVSAIAGVSVAQHVANVPSAAALAVGLAMGMMFLFRCLHPPGGAIALAAVLGGPSIHQLGYNFVVWPVLGNALLLLASAVAFNTITGRVYSNSSKPHRDSSVADEFHQCESGLGADELNELKGCGQVTDVDQHNLQLMELRSDGQNARRGVCRDAATSDVVAMSPDCTLTQALLLLRTRDIATLPVTNDRGTVIAIVMLTDPG
jgi:CBS domain-containing membrane protein